MFFSIKLSFLRPTKEKWNWKKEIYHQVRLRLKLEPSAVSYGSSSFVLPDSSSISIFFTWARRSRISYPSWEMKEERKNEKFCLLRYFEEIWDINVLGIFTQILFPLRTKSNHHLLIFYTNNTHSSWEPSGAYTLESERRGKKIFANM